MFSLAQPMFFFNADIYMDAEESAKHNKLNVCIKKNFRKCMWMKVE
jgi:hypothetical protein